jgi:hypothetical protein
MGACMWMDWIQSRCLLTLRFGGVQQQPGGLVRVCSGWVAAIARRKSGPRDSVAGILDAPEESARSPAIPDTPVVTDSLYFVGLGSRQHDFTAQWPSQYQCHHHQCD